MEEKLNFHRLMVLRSFYDNTFIIMGLLCIVLPELSEAYKSGIYSYIFPTAFPFARIAATGTMYSTIAITIERYLAVCCPFYAVSRTWSAKRYIVPIVIFSFLYNLPIFFEYENTVCKKQQNETATIVEIQNNTEMAQQANGSLTDIHQHKIKEKITPTQHNKFLNNCTSDYVYISPSTMRLDYTYFVVYRIGFELFFKCILPFVVLIVLNAFMVKTLVLDAAPKEKIYLIPISKEDKASIGINGKEVEQPSKVNVLDTKHDTLFLAKVNLMIALLFILCHSIRWIPFFYEMKTEITGHVESVMWKWPKWINTITDISNFLIIVASSMNCYIYYRLPMYLFLKTLCYGKNY